MEINDEIALNLYESARNKAIGKVIDKHLNGYKRVLEISDYGIAEFLRPNRTNEFFSLQDMMSFPKEAFRKFPALIAFDCIDEVILTEGKGLLESNGIFCYFSDAPVTDLYEFYTEPKLPVKPCIHTGEDLNKWLDSMGFKTTDIGMVQAAEYFKKWDVQMEAGIETLVPMYDLVDRVMVVSNIYYNISQLITR
ncbi:MAG: hypothetical protein ACOCQG_06235 [Candidatus Nanoarchaeia archaeon]